jgi:hypothetical protein
MLRVILIAIAGASLGSGTAPNTIKDLAAKPAVSGLNRINGLHLKSKTGDHLI